MVQAQHVGPSLHTLCCNFSDFSLFVHESTSFYTLIKHVSFRNNSVDQLLNDTWRFTSILLVYTPLFVVCSSMYKVCIKV